jgi:hypothetical protein
MNGCGMRPPIDPIITTRPRVARSFGISALVIANGATSITSI